MTCEVRVRRGCTSLRYRRRVPTTATAPTAAGLAARGARFDRLDALRAAAIVWMAVFHFCYDLNYFRFIRQNFYTDPVWTVQRTCIVSLFLFCAGLSQAVACDQAQTWPRFWRRWRQVAGCALLVTLGSWWMFPHSVITFGVLHCIALLVIILRLSSGAGAWLWPLGLLALALPWFVSDPWFDTRATNWIGLVTKKPITEDYVPLLPWLGVAWWGLAAGRWVLAHRRDWLTGALPRALQPLAALGRWSLTFYMLHQLVLLGLLGVIVRLTRP